MTRRVLTGLVAVLLGAATGLVVLQAPAQAAGCAAGTGVTVVVDPHQLGGGATTRCVDGGKRKAADAFSAANINLARVIGQPGFVCRVNSKPSQAACGETPPDDAYWSLWVSTGDGSWSYASIGVDGLSVPKGGWVAFSWQGQSGRAQPGVRPVGAAAPKPAAPPATGSSTGGSGGSSADAAPGGAASDEEAEAEEKAAERRKAEKAEETERAKKAAARRAAASASPSASASAAGETAEARATSASSTSSAPWGTVVGIVGVLVLLAAAGVLAWRRRSSAP